MGDFFSNSTGAAVYGLEGVLGPSKGMMKRIWTVFARRSCWQQKVWYQGPSTKHTSTQLDGSCQELAMVQYLIIKAQISLLSREMPLLYSAKECPLVVM